MPDHYEIRDWDRKHESFRTRRAKRAPRTLPVSTGYLDTAHRLIVAAGPAVLGVQFALIKLAAHMPARGVFIDDSGSALSGDDMAGIVGIDSKVFRSALKVLLRPQVDFLVFIGDKPEKLEKKRRGRPSRKELDPDLEAQAEEIYQAYPRKTAKKAALRAIIKALKKEEFSILLEKVTRYSYIRKGEPMQFTPHPATWFNDERYKESESSWRNHKQPAGDAGPLGRAGGNSSEYRIED